MQVSSMDTKGRAVVYGVAALVVAVAVLGVSTLSGAPVLSNLVKTVGPGTPGTFSVLLTDPPHVPSGVTAVYVTYSDLRVYVSEAGNESGWTEVSSGGTIDLMSTVNVSQTIAAEHIPVGDYNALSFNVTSAEVTYNGQNYTAFVVDSRIFVPILHGGIEVNDSSPSATIIDISPLVINIGSSSTPEFVIRTVAVAFPVPSNQITDEMEHDGFRFALAHVDWWDRLSENASANLRVTAASLSSNSLSVTADDIGNATTIKLVIVSPLASPLVAGMQDEVPQTVFGSDIFVVQSNGTLIQLHQFLKSVISASTEPFDQLRDAFANTGFQLASGSNYTFSYSGAVSFGFNFGPFTSQSVVSGQQYLVTVIGTDAIAGQVVVAS